MRIGIGYADACAMPLNLAYAFLMDGRQKNTHPEPVPQSKQKVEKTTYVASKRKYPKR